MLKGEKMNTLLFQFSVLFLIAFSLLVHTIKYLPEVRREKFNRILLMEVKNKDASTLPWKGYSHQKVFELSLKPIDMQILVYGLSSNIEIPHFTNERYYNSIEIGDLLEYDFEKKEILKNLGK